MKKLFLILAGAAALSFQACQSDTAVKDRTIDENRNSSENSMRTSDRNDEKVNATANREETENLKDSANTDKNNSPVETGALDKNDK